MIQNNYWLVHRLNKKGVMEYVLGHTQHKDGNHFVYIDHTYSNKVEPDPNYIRRFFYSDYKGFLRYLENMVKHKIMLFTSISKEKYYLLKYPERPLPQDLQQILKK